MGLDANGAVGGFDKSPLEVVVDVAAGAAVANVAAAGDDARDKTRITGQVFGAGKAIDIADFQPDQRREDRTPPANAMVDESGVCEGRLLCQFCGVGHRGEFGE
jgi:hypothetical protein